MTQMPAGIGADILKDQQMGDAYFLSGNFEIEVTVSWPIITIPNDVVEYPEKRIYSNTPLNQGSKSIEVTNSSIYHVHVGFTSCLSRFKKQWKDTMNVNELKSIFTR